LSPGDAQTARGLGRFAPNPLAAFAELGIVIHLLQKYSNVTIMLY